MKIGIVCYPTFGGSGIVATELGISLAKRGHQVHFITYERPARLTSFQENITFHEVRIPDYPLFHHLPYETALAGALVEVVRYASLDVLHVHYAIPHAAVAYMAKKILESKGLRLPTITTLHGTDITLVGIDESFAPVVEFSINQSEGVTAVSKHLKDRTLESFNIKTEIRVLPNFIDFDRFKPTNKDHFRKALAPDGEKIIAHISNFRKVKRVEDVIRIFNNIHQRLPSKLLMIGDGPERPRLEKLCRELAICHDVRFLGKQDAVEELLAISDLFILPSENESFGLAALEALACEVPVISSNAGGIPEVNIHGQTGFLSDVGDIESMSKNALRLLEHPYLLDQYSKNAFDHAKTFDINRIVPLYESYYQEVYEKNLVNGKQPN